MRSSNLLAGVVTLDKQRPGRVGSQYLLSGLLRCGVCGRPYSGQGAKSGRFAYYVCGSLFREGEGAGACTARYLNAAKVEDLVIEKVRERILTEETITELVTLVAEEIDNLAGEVNGRLTAAREEAEGQLEQRRAELLTGTPPPYSVTLISNCTVSPAAQVKPALCQIREWVPDWFR